MDKSLPILDQLLDKNKKDLTLNLQGSSEEAAYIQLGALQEFAVETQNILLYARAREYQRHLPIYSTLQNKDDVDMYRHLTAEAFVLYIRVAHDDIARKSLINRLKRSPL